MANFIEKRLPEAIRSKMSTLIAGALGLFLGLQYNDYVKALVEKVLPNTDSLVVKGVILIGLTVVVVYGTVLISKLLDGK